MAGGVTPSTPDRGDPAGSELREPQHPSELAMGDLVGVDIGGTKVAAARLHRGELGDSLVQPTERGSAAALIDQIVRLVDSVRSEEVSAVGVGVPSVIEFETGRVVSSVNVPLGDIPLRDVLNARLGVPVFVDNDATLAALAEAHDEQLRSVAENLVMITIGTGVGGGLVLGGRIYRGATGAAGELGHTLVGLALSGDLPVPAATANFPQPWSLEYVAAGSALDRLARYALRRCLRWALAQVRPNGRPVLGPDVVQAARDGDPLAERLVEIWAGRVGIAIANAINTFDPEQVVIGGGAATAGELLFEPAARVASDYVLPGVGTRTTIRLARHGVRAGVLGAALLAMHELAANQPTCGRFSEGPVLASPRRPDGRR